MNYHVPVLYLVCLWICLTTYLPSKCTSIWLPVCTPLSIMPVPVTALLPVIPSPGTSGLCLWYVSTKNCRWHLTAIWLHVPTTQKQWQIYADPVRIRDPPLLCITKIYYCKQSMPFDNDNLFTEYIGMPIKKLEKNGSGSNKMIRPNPVTKHCSHELMFVLLPSTVYKYSKANCLLTNLCRMLFSQS